MFFSLELFDKYKFSERLVNPNKEIYGFYSMAPFINFTLSL